ncbi:diguanylate cyclase (GGDEF)-like protein/PAS domain S-box-containing protein [Sporomusaceae bacterium BoRhaA]|uniref:PAS domain S-box protein n=1 Tax=Pelorhabdus rhamnosifermentans TaxID=2772457 RepID=UPI001C061D80|nr:PAS domain S-box protein [Pelorhabdus rhamnosifermentans]MBU2702856.1 diguanylate cyclase (GGDEF)-like protein/PAS domain S-box-containing protein [Pelorhabdus rhamnosifermentans]
MTELSKRRFVLSDELQLHAKLFDITTSGIVVLTAEGIVIDVNPAFSSITGYERAEVIGEDANHLPLFQKEALLMSWQDILTEMKIKLFCEEFCFVQKSGQQRIVRLNVYPVWWDANQLDLYFLSLQDITKQKTVESFLQQSEEKYRNIFNATSDMLFIATTAGKILDANEAACRMLHYTKEELCHFYMRDIVVPQLEGSITELAHYFTTHGAFENDLEQQYIRKDGSSVFCELHVTSFVSQGQTWIVVAAHDITARLLARNQLRASELRYRSLVQQSSDGVFIFDAVTLKIEEVNKQFAKMMRYEEAEMCTLIIDDIVATALDDVKSKIQFIRQHHTAFFGQRIYRRKDGSVFDVESAMNVVHYHDKQVVMVNVRDITDRKQSEERLRLAQTVFDNTIDGIIVINRLGTILSINEAFTALTGYSAEDIVGEGLKFLQSCIHDTEFLVELWRKVQASGQWQGEIWNRRKTGEEFTAWLNLKAVMDGEGRINKVVGVFSDLTARDHYVTQIRHQAFHDALTGLPNRALYYERLDHLLAYSQRTDQMFGVMFLDLDGFKMVNDEFGHNTGDLLLRAVAERVKSCIRSSDTLARMGGDEFTLLLPQIQQVEDVITVAQKIISAFKLPYKLQQSTHQVTTSIGIALYPFHSRSAETLLKQADTAMYRAKYSGKNHFVLY